MGEYLNGASCMVVVTCGPCARVRLIELVQRVMSNASPVHHYFLSIPGQPLAKKITAIAMALIVDKHRPRSLDNLTYHEDLSERLRSLVRGSGTTFAKVPSLTPNTRRPKAVTSPTFSSMDHPVPAKRHELSRL